MNEIKYYHVHRYNDEQKCALFVTNDNKVYGINIPYCMMTSSYFFEFEKRENNFEKSKPIEIKEIE